MLITRYFFLAGWIIWILVFLLAVTAVLICFSGFMSKSNKLGKGIPWLSYILMIGIIACFFTAFRISALGLHGYLTGLTNSSDKAAYLLLTFYPYFPLTAINVTLGASSILSTQYIGIIKALKAFDFIYSILLGLSVLSFFSCKIRRGRLFLSVLFAASGLLFTFFIKTGFRDIPQPVPDDFLQAAPMINFYCSAIATLLSGMIFYMTVKNIPQTIYSWKKTENTLPDSGAPVVAVLLIIFTFFTLSLADMENIHSLERKGRAIISTNF